MTPSERGRNAPAAKLDVVVLVLAVWRVVERQVGDCGQVGFERGRGLTLLRLQSRHFRFRIGDFGAEILGGDTILARHRRADLLRGGVAALLRALERQDRRAAPFIERDQRFGARTKAAAPQTFVKGFRILADRSHIVHECRLSLEG